MYGTAHVKVYKKTCNPYCVHALRNFEGITLTCWACATQGIHCARVITDELKILASNSCRAHFTRE